MNATCDDCGATFQPTLREDTFDDGSVVQVMPCPECGSEYDICRITARGVKLRDKLAKMRKGTVNREAYRMVLNDYQGEITKLAGGE